MFGKLYQTFRLGMKSLLLHKLRSALAVLGILIGVTAVIWLVAMGEGVSYQAQQQIKELGATNIIVRSVRPTKMSVETAGSFFIDYGLKREDFQRLSNIPSVVRAVPLRELESRIARNLDREETVRIVGCRPEFKEMNQLTMAEGRFLETDDETNVKNYCVLAAHTARTLFPYESAYKKKVQLDQDFYTVVGVTNERGSTGNIGGSFAGQNFDKDVYIPLRTLKSRIGDRVLTAKAGAREGEVVELNQITVMVSDIDQVDETAKIIGRLMEQFHRSGDYTIIVPKELLKQAELTRMMFNALLVLVAGISLLVGGIGIMNIMLATVTERTREIGIRRALGAKQRDIVHQFLSETLVLSGTGGILGVLLGFSVTYVVWLARWISLRFFSDMYLALDPSIREIEPRIAPWSVAAAFCISIFVGVAFGMYPARRASEMDPIEALRHE
jgi:putative ABC transport system permease protein